jgi:hypothetical protein
MSESPYVQGCTSSYTFGAKLSVSSFAARRASERVRAETNLGENILICHRALELFVQHSGEHTSAVGLEYEGMIGVEQIKDELAVG